MYNPFTFQRTSAVKHPNWSPLQNMLSNINTHLRVSQLRKRKPQEKTTMICKARLPQSYMANKVNIKTDLSVKHMTTELFWFFFVCTLISTYSHHEECLSYQSCQRQQETANISWLFPDFKFSIISRNVELIAVAFPYILVRTASGLNIYGLYADAADKNSWPIQNAIIDLPQNFTDETCHVTLKFMIKQIGIRTIIWLIEQLTMSLTDDIDWKSSSLRMREVQTSAVYCFCMKVQNNGTIGHQFMVWIEQGNLEIHAYQSWYRPKGKKKKTSSRHSI